MLLSEEIYRHHDFYLDAYFKPPLDHAKYPSIADGEYPYMIERDQGHLFYFYPPGSSILSVPFLAVLNRFGFSPVGADQQYDQNGELAIEGRIAAVLMAAFTACVFLTANLLSGSLGWSFVIAFGTALGTQIWSTASRVLWSHTWGVLLLGLAILYLVGGEQRRWRVNPVILATLMAWTFLVRPTNAIAYAVVSIYVVLRLRSILRGLRWRRRWCGWARWSSIPSTCSERSCQPSIGRATGSSERGRPASGAGRSAGQPIAGRSDLLPGAAHRSFSG